MKQTSSQKHHSIVLLVFLAGAFVLVFFIFRPFFDTLVLAIAFAVAFRPLQQKLLDHTPTRRGLAAFFTTIVVAALVVTLLIFLSMQILEEAWQLYSSVLAGGGLGNSFLVAINGFIDNLQRSLPSSFRVSLDINQYIRQGLSWLLQNIISLFSNFTKIVVSFFIFLFALYYLLKDGPELKKSIVALSPLTDTDDEAILHKLERAINSVLRGSLVIALVQGALTAIGFIVFGVPNAILWGSLAAVASLIPTIGTSLVIVPAIAFLFLSGETFSALGLFAWGAVAVGLIDNFLGPKLVGRGTQLHPFLIFISVIGGLGFFGPLGFLLGPLTLSLFFALLEIYFSLRKGKVV
ncbi:MAG: AI-2E family transporter [bacterium]|nr:AI-2E family transporter [bacterium]